MRIDAFGPRTWLLATLAGWALLVWILALFGMGGQVRPLPDDPSLVVCCDSATFRPVGDLGDHTRGTVTWRRTFCRPPRDR